MVNVFQQCDAHTAKDVGGKLFALMRSLSTLSIVQGSGKGLIPLMHGFGSQKKITVHFKAQKRVFGLLWSG